MATENWTSPDEVRSRWIADETLDDDSKLTVKIGQAERAIRREFPTMAARLQALNSANEPVEPDLPALIADVVHDLVQDNFVNPLGVRSTQDTEGPWTVQKTVAGDNPGKIMLTSHHRKLLAPPSSGSRMKSIDLAAGSYAAGGQGRHVNSYGVVVTSDGWPV